MIKLGSRTTTTLFLTTFLVMTALALRDAIVLADPPAVLPPLPRLKPHREPVLASPEEAQVASQLDKPIRAGEFVQLPLGDALLSLNKWNSLGFDFDENAFNAKHQGLKQEVTLDYPRMPLRLLLQVLLEPVGLDWVIRDGKLVISLRIEADQHFSRWKYDVSDLVVVGIPAEELAAAIRETIVPNDGERAGDKGTIATEGDFLVVRQRREIHKLVEQMLKFVREELTEYRQTAGTRRSRLFTIRYSLENLFEPEAAIAEFERAISIAVVNGGWKKPYGPGRIAFDGGKLQLTHYAWVHDQVRLLFGLTGEIEDTDSNGMRLSFQSRVVTAYNLLRETYPPMGDIDQSVSLDLQNFELTEVVGYFRHLHGVFCDITEESRARVPVNHTFVTCSQKQGSLGSALDLIFEPLKLDWFVVHDGLVKVVPPEVAAIQRGVQVYRIREAVEAGTSATEIIHSIAEQVDPPSWKAAGGTAIIRTLPGLLVVSHNRRAHTQISKLLAELGQP